jgi:FkbM family methyltransferase
VKLGIVVSSRAARSMAKRAALRMGIAPTWARQLRTAQARRDRRDNLNFKAILPGILHPDSNCLDIGASYGGLLDEIVRVAPQGKHIAVEPVAERADELRRRFPDVEVIQCAVSDAAGHERFYVADDTALSGLRRRDWLGTDYRDVEVQTTTLDELVPADLKVAFIKLDVEGAELLALRGASRILSDDRPVLWVEHSGSDNSRAYGTSSGDLWDLLASARYRGFDADGNGPLDRETFCSIDGRRMFTFLFTPL